MCDNPDSEARFARRLGRMVGRVDWWKLFDEMSPNEWALTKRVIDDGTAQ